MFKKTAEDALITSEDIDKILNETNDAPETEAPTENSSTDELKTKLLNAIDAAAVNIVKGLAKHNLEQFWWKKLSAGEELEPRFYSASLSYINNYGNTKGPEIAEKIKSTLSADANGVSYDFPFPASNFLGEFTVPFPEKVTTSTPHNKLTS